MKERERCLECAWGFTRGHRPLSGFLPSLGITVFEGVWTCVCVCVRESLLRQEHIGSPGVMGCSLRGTRVPDVPRNVTAEGFGNLSRAFPAFREAFFLASLATCDLVHLKLGD